MHSIHLWVFDSGERLFSTVDIPPNSAYFLTPSVGCPGVNVDLGQRVWLLQDYFCGREDDVDDGDDEVCGEDVEDDEEVAVEEEGEEDEVDGGSFTVTV